MLRTRGKIATQIHPHIRLRPHTRLRPSLDSAPTPDPTYHARLHPSLSYQPFRMRPSQAAIPWLSSYTSFLLSPHTTSALLMSFPTASCCKSGPQAHTSFSPPPPQNQGQHGFLTCPGCGQCQGNTLNCRNTQSCLCLVSIHTHVRGNNQTKRRHTVTTQSCTAAVEAI